MGLCESNSRIFSKNLTSDLGHPYGPYNPHTPHTPPIPLRLPKISSFTPIVIAAEDGADNIGNHRYKYYNSKHNIAILVVKRPFLLERNRNALTTFDTRCWGRFIP